MARRRDDDDDDDDRDLGGEAGADERRIEATKKRASARAKTRESEDDDRSDVDDSKEQAQTKEDAPEEIVVDDEDEEEEEAPRSPRRERRANRYREMQERAAAAEERAERAERAAQSVQAQVNSLQQARSAGPPQPSAIDREVDEVYQARVQLTETYEAHKAAGRLTAEVHKQISDKARELESKQYRLEARREILANQPRPVDPVVAHIQATNHDVLSHPQASTYAQGEFQRLRALNPSGDHKEMITKAFGEARKAFRMPSPNGAPAARPAAPAATQAARYGAQPRGGGGGGDSGGGRVVKMTEARKRMAEAMFEHEPDVSKRHRLWAKKVGTKLKG